MSSVSEFVEVSEASPAPLQAEAELVSLMRENNQSLFRMARSILKSDSEAEEVVQSAYVAAYTKLEQLSGDSRLAAWLRKITVNRAYDRLRHIERERRAEEGRRDLDREQRVASGLFRSPEEESSRRQLRGKLEDAIDLLPDTLRLVFVMRDVQEMSGAETADSLGIEEGAVRVRLHRARGLIRARLGGELQELYPEAFHFAGERCDRIVARTLQSIRITEASRPGG